MPVEFVERWPELTELADGLVGLEDELTDLSEVATASNLVALNGGPGGTLSLKDETDYLATVKGGAQRRSRRHERLIRIAVERLQRHGAAVSTPHPRDLLISMPVSVVVEAKIARRGALFAVREAVGQLLEYRHFLGPKEAELCILLDRSPGEDLIGYVERELGLLVLWPRAGRLVGGPLTAAKLERVGVLAEWGAPVPAASSTVG
ncbi:MAG: hypothetical protein JRI55_27980 [Deltaproteobacteria bacterium]|nr:hypothetical protein [Deltaproteobacteria bacterium]